MKPLPIPLPLRSGAALLAMATGLSGCATSSSDEPEAMARPETVFAVTESHQLIRFNAGTPGRIDAELALRGLAAGETLVGIDFRVARGVLYGLSSAGRLVTIDTTSGLTQAVGSAPPVGLKGTRFGVDFNPVADRVRVVSDGGQNLRLHPDTGALAATDPPLAAAAPNGPVQQLAGAGYTYNKKNDKLTTNYAIDIARGWLVTQGSVEATEPVVSPNTGRIFDVGALGTGALDDAALDIADTDNSALAALRQGGRTRLYLVDLVSGKARLLGTAGRGGALRGLAIQP